MSKLLYDHIMSTNYMNLAHKVKSLKKLSKNLKKMGKTKELFIKLREQEEFLKEHIIICTLKPEGTVTTAPNNN